MAPPPAAIVKLTRCSLSSRLISSLIIYSAVLIYCSAAGAAEKPVVLDTEEPKPAEEILTSEQLHMMSTRMPRQQFRIHQLSSASGRQHSSPFKLIKVHKGRAALASASKAKVASELAAPEDRRRGNQTHRPQTGPKLLLKETGKKISDATLKKLLAQTLPRLNATVSQAGEAGALNATTLSKGPHFKFVFLQRATAAPSAGDSSSTAAVSRRPKASTGTTQAQNSLAASVSKQLASSLFYSASNLVGNLTSASTLVPASLSALAALAQQRLQQFDDHSANDLDASSSSSSGSTATTAMASPMATEPIDETNVDKDDIRRLSELHKATTKSRPTRKPRPSKIYNLPVKFVANGQPNHVVAFHSIKQHFATIKRLQQSVSSGAQQADRKKASASQLGVARLKGKNSRLIYLPLKYLSNAKPNMLNVIAGTKASHKSMSSGDSH